MRGRERLAGVASGGTFAVVAVALAVVPGIGSWPAAWVVLLFVGVYALFSHIEFEVGPGSAIPAQLVLVPMLFVLPPAVVPLAVGVGFVLGGFADSLVHGRNAERSFVLLSSSWHAVGPALVIWGLAPGPPRWSALPVYLLALGAQFACDSVSTYLRESMARGTTARELVGPLGWTFLVDSLLAPVGLLAAFAATTEPLAVLVVIPLAALLRLFAVDRSQRIDRALALSRAYEDANLEARRDPLTGLSNRLAWEEAILRAERALQEQGSRSTIVVLDLDGLKGVNDTRGHAFGDRLLSEAADVLRQAVPASAVAARIGGDEFGILVAGDARLADGIAARIDALLAGHSGIDGVRLSVSIGSASSPPARTLKEAFMTADARLYEHKAQARAAKLPRAG
jgi:diguanylate cyclase (GGDEF)-like protein